ncbi:hypothetical protein EDD21DRAFT_415211 [Dissophora ornata]|nr:hypothetical protein EDD21DRAFT_415211 [Dissophora ornata]
MSKPYAALYPFLGILYLSKHIRQLGPQFLRSLLFSFLTTLAILLPLSALTFKYQRRLILFVLRFFLASFSFFFPSSKTLSFLGLNLPTWSALILTVGETSILVALVMGEVFKKEKSKGLFKAVIAHNNVLMGPLATVTHHTNHHHHHSSKRLTHRNKDVAAEDSILVAATDAMISHKEMKHRKRDLVKSASTQVGQRILLWFMTLPLNFLPVAGPVTFCYINGKARVPDVHRRYFDMKGMTVDERKVWIKRREPEYIAFAFVSQGLELVPVLGILFGFTNTIGAALWAVDLEQQQDALRNKKLLSDAYASEP